MKNQQDLHRLSCARRLMARWRRSTRPALAAVAISAPLIMHSMPAHASGVYEVPQSIAADCSADVAAEINEWIRSVPDNSTLQFLRGACYRVDRQITVADRHGLVLAGNNSTLRSMREVNLEVPNGNDAILQMERGSNHQVRDLNILGPHPDYDDFNRNAAHLPGIRVRGVDTLLFERISVSFVWGDFIEVKANIEGEPRNFPSQNVTIRNSRFERAGRQGINISGAENVLVKGNVIKNAHFSAIDQEAVQGAMIARNVTITENQFFGPDTMKFLTSTHKTLTTIGWDVSNNVLRDMSLDVTFYSAPENPKQDIRIIGNTSDTEGGTAVRLYAVQNARVRGNIAVMKEGKTAVELQSVADVVVRENVFKGAMDLLVVDRGVWLGLSYEGPASTGFRTCNNIISESGEPPPVDGSCG